jgi:hypothetical protein
MIIPAVRSVGLAKQEQAGNNIAMKEKKIFILLKIIKAVPFHNKG